VETTEVRDVETNQDRLGDLHNRDARGSDVRPARVVDRGKVNEVFDNSARLVAAPVASNSVTPMTKGEYSPKPKKSRSLKIKSEHSPRQNAGAEVIDMAAFKASVTIHPPAVFDAERWKRSRVKKGYLIARIPGYDVVEGEYGVHYLKVIKRDPKTGKKKTSGDCSLYEHAGFSTWRTLQASARLVRERKRYERVNENRADAS
jgi:hypothetical protein